MSAWATPIGFALIVASICAGFASCHVAEQRLKERITESCKELAVATPGKGVFEGCVKAARGW